MKRILFWVAALAWIAPALAQVPTPAGLWTTISDTTGKPEAMVRIVEMDGQFHGTVTEIFPAMTPGPVCELCEGEMKNKPVVGMTILRGLRPDGDGYGGGTILDPDEGRIYRCAMALHDNGHRLEVRGYIGLPWFGRTQTWIRAN